MGNVIALPNAKAPPAPTAPTNVTTLVVLAVIAGMLVGKLI